MKLIKKFKKRGYFFIFDVGLSIFVLLLGLIIVFSYYFNVYSTHQSSYFSTNIMDILSNTKIYQSNNNYFGFNGDLHKNGNITNIQNSLLTQMSEFYYRSEEKDCDYCLNLINNSFNQITDLLISENYYYIVKINNTVVFNTTKDIPFYNSTQLIPSKKIVYGIYENNEIFGPYGFEVWAWR
ncbi:MAG: hypothetical protein ACOC3X_01680 [Nanoarchaeota archaeon]